MRPFGKIEVNFPVCLAPMVGLSHIGTRLLLKEYFPEGAKTIWPTEMLNSRRLPTENLQRTPETLRHSSENGLVPQILGNEERFIRDSVKKLEDWGAEGIDINMGCPVKKALQHNYGVALMGDPKYARDVVEMSVRSTGLPVSVKLRAGQKEHPDHLIPFVKALEEGGASWVTLHPRFAHEHRRGSADWSKIQILRQSLSIPVIGNGDVQTSPDVHRMLKVTDCDMVMVGRAMTARPWMVWQLAEDWGWSAPKARAGERAPRTPEEEGREYGRMLRRMIGICREYFAESFPERGEELALRKLRFFVRTGSPWLEFGNLLYGKVMKAKTLAEMDLAVGEFFSGTQRMMSFTSLRH